MNKAIAKEKALDFLAKNGMPDPSRKENLPDKMIYVWDFDKILIIKMEITDKNQRKWSVGEDSVEEEYAVKLVNKLDKSFC